MTSRWAGSLDEECLRACAEAFAGRVIRLAESLPMTGAAGLCGDELLQSANLIRANCQDTLRTTSGEEFRHKLGVVEEEARECGVWLELLAEAEFVEQSKLDELTEEADGLVAVVAMTMWNTCDSKAAEAGLRDSEAPRLKLRR